MVKNVLIYGNKVLKEESQPVVKIDDEVLSTIRDLKDTLNRYKGFGLAAPQIGSLLRIFVFYRQINEQFIDKIEVVINPTIIDSSKEIQRGKEGCLSFPIFSTVVDRPQIVTMMWTKLDGSITREVFEGTEARIVMHEFDHLDGKLISDTVSSLAKKKQLKRTYKKVSKGTYLILPQLPEEEKIWNL